MTALIIKSLLTSLFQREEFPPLLKRGARGDFLKNICENLRESAAK
ncbi:MAG: hypothetical protein AABZ36_08665 [Nitrospirota bacterium]